MQNDKIREIIGYTFEKESNNYESWYKNALSFHECTIVLFEAETLMEPRACLVNAALSLELILKAILTLKHIKFKPTHDLNLLRKSCDIDLTNDQIVMLCILTSMFDWVGRYPVPTNENKWNNYYDVELEKAIIREKTERGYLIMANRNRLPSKDGYEMLWGLFLEKYKRLLLADKNS